MPPKSSISWNVRSQPPAGTQSIVIRAVAMGEWPAADQLAWSDACRPAQRLRRGGLASHMKAVTRDDLVQRYGLFLNFVRRSEGLDSSIEAAGYVTHERVDRFVAELNDRVSSVTAYGTIYKLRRMTQLLAPSRDVIWLTEIEKDLAFVMQPRSKLDRLVLTQVLVEAGMTLMMEADRLTQRPDLARARQFRNGLMVALLALCSLRLKNFTALEIGRTFKEVSGEWWIVLAAADTKEGRADERPVPAYLTQWIERYLGVHRPALAHADQPATALWLSSRGGRKLSYSGIERAVSETTLATVGVDLSPHLFRTAGASTAAMHASNYPKLASAILHHAHPAVTEENYIRASNLTAAQDYAELIKSIQRGD